MELSEQIKIRLKRKNMTQNELARQAGLSKSGMSTIATGAYDPRLSNLIAIARVLDCSVGELLGETTSQTSKYVTDAEWRLLAAYRAAEPAFREEAVAMLERHAIIEKAAAAS